jgi:hypothetical protein
LTVTDISFQVGFNSLGTFTTRFTYSVGVSPARFRNLAHQGLPLPRATEAGSREQTGAAHGTIVLPSGNTPLRIYVGAFSSPIVEGVPESCDVLTGLANGCREHPYRLLSVRMGEWFIRAVGVRHVDVDPRPWTRQPLFIGSAPVTVRSDHSVTVNLAMRAVSSTDLPILLALPELDCHLPLNHRQAYRRPEMMSEQERLRQRDPPSWKQLRLRRGVGGGHAPRRAHHSPNGPKQYAGSAPPFPWLGGTGDRPGGQQSGK